MRNNNKKRELLSEDVQHQNEELNIKSLLEFMKLSHLLDKYLDAKLGVYGLNRTQRRIVSFILSKNNFMTPTELSRLSLLTIDTINKSVDTLDNMGLTRSYRSRKDRRVRRVTLTEKGLEMIEKILPLRYLTFSQIMSCFSKGEIKVFFQYIQRFIDHISHLTEQDAASTAPEISYRGNLRVLRRRRSNRDAPIHSRMGDIK